MITAEQFAVMVDALVADIRTEMRETLNPLVIHR